MRSVDSMTTPMNKTVWIVTSPSAYRLGHSCFLGRGETKDEALTNAFGPKPWTKYVRSIMRKADVYEVADTEADLMEHSGTE